MSRGEGNLKEKEYGEKKKRKKTSRALWICPTDMHTVIEFVRDSLATECQRSVTRLVMPVELDFTSAVFLVSFKTYTTRNWLLNDGVS